ncbi:MAG: zinc-ribbon domain-containing protein [Sphingomicrobium sp.]
MILTCPACGTSYSVKDGAIPPHGRTVRCAACKHSWHQPGEAGPAEPIAAEPPAEAPAPIAEIAAPASSPAIDEAVPGFPEPESPDDSFAAPPPPVEADESALPDDAATAPSGALEAAVPDEALAADQAAEWNDAGYGADEPAPRRKGPLILLGLVLLIATLAATTWFLAPRAWMARAGLVAASSDSPLQLMVTSQDRQKLASGNDLVSLSGRVINPTDATQAVPALQADLRDGGGKLVYSWTIAPPTARLAPRASASFNAAELGVPANATSLTLRWAS